MRTRILLVSVGLLVSVCGIAHTKQTAPPAGTSVPELPGPAPFVVPEAARQPSKPVEVPLAELSVDQLLDKLEKLRAQKTELEKQEQELLKAVRTKVDKQSDRLTKLGVVRTEPAVAPVLPDPSSIPSVPKLPKSNP